MSPVHRNCCTCEQTLKRCHFAFHTFLKREFQLERFYVKREWNNLNSIKTEHLRSVTDQFHPLKLRVETCSSAQIKIVQNSVVE